MEESIDKTIRNLIDAGCDEQFINRFMSLCGKQDTAEKLSMLAKQRKSLLDNIHSDEHRIYCLDYLMNRLKQGE